MSDHDTELVIRHKRAGLIVLGKTNTPEFGIPPTTEPRLFGPTHNPWDTGRTPGGSIRIPASCCGLFGLKPTRARNPLGPDLGDDWGGLVAEHALTRSVRDSAALLDATSGPDLGDPYWAPPPERPFIEEVGADPGKLRIAFATQTITGTPLHPDCIAAVKDAAALCADLGHDVVEASPTIDRELLTQPIINVIAASGATATVDGWARRLGRTPAPEHFEPLTWGLYQMGRQQTASAYILGVRVLQRLSRDIARFFLDHDVWLTPTLGEPPLPLGSFDPTPENPLKGFMRAVTFVPFTPICNVTGQPAVSIPLYWNAEGLPVGTHFVARFGDEATLFRLAAQLEQARPWADRRPPVSAEAVSA